jgi:hypothetical protein
MVSKERRSHHRVDAEIAGHIVGHKGHEAIALRTRNISQSGFYCRVPLFVAPFTRLRVSVFLPAPGKADNDKTKVDLEGVVVRTDPQKESPAVKQYHLAVFFDSLTPVARSAVLQYVERCAGKSPSV